MTQEDPYPLQVPLSQRLLAPALPPAQHEGQPTPQPQATQALRSVQGDQKEWLEGIEARLRDHVDTKLSAATRELQVRKEVHVWVMVMLMTVMTV